MPIWSTSSDPALRRSRVLFALAIALGAIGVCLLTLGWTRSPRDPPVHPAGTLPPAGAARAPAAAPPPARPVNISIPAIRVHTRIIRLGLQKDGSLQVPPLNHANLAGWYTGSATPGSIGASVIVGHVDSDAGPALFYNLGSLKPGNHVQVRRDDGRTAVFSVDRIASFPKKTFPTRLVYGPVKYAGLRLITCGGDYVKSAGGYQNNVVVFASLLRLDPATAGHQQHAASTAVRTTGR